MKPLKQLKDLTLLDRFLFSEVMENPKYLETILEIILGRDVLLRCLPQTERNRDVLLCTAISAWMSEVRTWKGPSTTWKSKSKTPSIFVREAATTKD